MIIVGLWIMVVRKARSAGKNIFKMFLKLF